MMVDPRGVPDRALSGTFLHLVDVKIDDVELNLNPFTEELVIDDDEPSLNKWRTNYIEGIVMNEIATTESNVVSWFHGAGNAYKVSEYSRICTADG